MATKWDVNVTKLAFQSHSVWHSTHISCKVTASTLRALLVSYTSMILTWYRFINEAWLLLVNCIFVCFLILLSSFVMRGWQWSRSSEKICSIPLSWGQCRFIGWFIDDSSSETRSSIAYSVGDILCSQPKATDYLSSIFIREFWKNLVAWRYIKT